MNFYSYNEKIVNSQLHTLIAGCTGSGKSVFLNNLICYILSQDNTGLILIDPKKVELSQYRNTTHTIMYGDIPSAIEQTLRYAVALMNKRYDIMQAQGIRKYTEEPVYVIIDELASFSTIEELRPCNALLSQLATLARAANIFLIACTQRPTNDVITPLYKVNCDCKIALRTASEQESRNIIGISDAKRLPKNGKCIMTHPDYLEPVILPVDFHTDKEIEEYIAPIKRQTPNKAQIKSKPKSIFRTFLELS